MGPNQTTLRSTVCEEMRRVAAEQKKVLVPLDCDTPLMATGLDSLCFAILVARLEETLEVDPFAADEAELPITVGDFISLYERALDNKQAPQRGVASSSVG